MSSQNLSDLIQQIRYSLSSLLRPKRLAKTTGTSPRPAGGFYKKASGPPHLSERGYGPAQRCRQTATHTR